MEYAELHAHSWFSFLDGVSSPAELARVASELGLSAVAITDHQTLAGAVQFTLACREYGIKPIIGAEITLAPWERSEGAKLPSVAEGAKLPSVGECASLCSVKATPDEASRWQLPVGPFSIDKGHHLVLIAKNEGGYNRLCKILSTAGLRDEKCEAQVSWETLAQWGEGLVALTGCLRGEVATALLRGEKERAEGVLAALYDIFGRDLYLEVQDNGLQEQAIVNEALLDLARRFGVKAVASQNVHYALPEGRLLNDVVTAIRHTCTLAAADGLLRPSGGFHFRSPAEMAQRFAGYPELLQNTVAIVDEVSFAIDNLHFPLPDFAPATGEDPFDCLERLAWAGAHDRYDKITARVRKQIRHELNIIRRLGLAPYFLLVHDIVQFARSQEILVQGRGSAANSAICYCLAITSVDPISMDLLFERFLSEERKEPPDIDIDIEHNRREEVIQYVYERYGRDNAALVCNVVTYHMRSAVREVAKTLGFSQRRVERISRNLSDRMTHEEVLSDLALVGFDPQSPEVNLVVEIARSMIEMPRHLGIHPGGMVICAVPLTEKTSLERARMEKRTIIPWDKDDTADVGMIKMDLLGLGMLSCISRAIKIVREWTGDHIDPATLDYGDQKVYDLMCRADTVGVFQIESRAQMSTLPRMQPRNFYDIVVEIALIRPGPIQGDMVHPYLRRRRGEEPITCLHPLLEPALERTLGVPLFQEQGMKVAVLAAGFTPTEADELRRAMAHKRSHQKIAAMRERLIAGMVKNGIDNDAIERIINQLAGFASYGFPESHAASFALLVFVSCYLKVYYPWAFYCSLLNSQPMGCYRPGTILADARRHGVVVLPVCAKRSTYLTRIEHLAVPFDDSRLRFESDCSSSHLQGELKKSYLRGEGGCPFALRLGYRLVNGIGKSQGEVLDAEVQNECWRSLLDFVRRSQLPEELLVRLARVGAFKCFGYNRREAIWKVKEFVRRPRGLFDLLLEEDAPLRVVAGGKEKKASAVSSSGKATKRQHVVWEYDEMGFTTTCHPVQLARENLCARGVFSTSTLLQFENGTKVKVAGEAVVKQKPPTAKGIVFLSLEDEEGIVNTVLMPQIFKKYRRLVLDKTFLLVEGTIERRYGAINVMVDKVLPLEIIEVKRRPRRMYTGIG